MKKYIYLIISIFSFLIIVTTFTELYLKYIGLGDPIVYDSNFVYGYAPKANQKKNRFNNSVVTINDVGLRSIENWSEKEKSKKIVFFGDSVTYGGSYIDDKDTFVFLSCKNLKQLNIVCGNAGVNSYGIHNIVYRSKYDERLGEIFLKVFMIVPDDFYRGLQNSKTAHFYLNKKKFFLPAIFEALNFVASKYDLNNYIGKLDDTIIDDNMYDLVNESIMLLNKEFKQLRNSSQNLLVFYIHPKKRTELSDYILKKISEKNEIIDLGKNLNDKFYYDSIHLNVEGHQAVSKIIKQKLMDFIKIN